jgi:hypothetical protein
VEPAANGLRAERPFRSGVYIAEWPARVEMSFPRQTLRTSVRGTELPVL